MSPTLTACPPLPPRVKGPVASIPDPHRFGRKLLELAIAQYEAAHRLEREVTEASLAARADTTFDRWVNVANLGRSFAESALLTAILGQDPAMPDGHLHVCEQLYHRGRGVRSGGRIYMAVPFSHFEPEDAPPGGSMMRLLVLDADAIDDPEANGAGSV